MRFARGAAPGWAARTAMNRGQILYRVAELMEGRFDQFTAEVAAAEGLRVAAARSAVGRSIDRWVWYAGWADKIAQVLGSSNPVGAPYFKFTVPEPTRRRRAWSRRSASSLLGLVSRLAPALVGAATPPWSSPPRRGRCPRSRWRRCSRPPTCPGGVVNILTGRKRSSCRSSRRTWTSTRIDVSGVPDDLRTDVELAAADSVKRIARRPRATTDARFDWLDDRAASVPSGSPRSWR